MPARQTGSCSTFALQGVHSWLLVLAAGGLLLSGCGGEDYELAPISGRVTLDGKPLAKIRVSFQPVSKRPDEPNPGPGSYGTTDTEGRYTLQTVESDADGAVVGTHRVHLGTKPPEQDPADDRAPVYKEIVPAQWRDGSQTFEVPPEGTDQANFHMKSR